MYKYRQKIVILHNEFEIKLILKNNEKIIVFIGYHLHLRYSFNIMSSKQAMSCL